MSKVGPLILASSIAALFLIGKRKPNKTSEPQSLPNDKSTKKKEGPCPTESIFDLSKIKYVTVPFEGGDGVIFNAEIPKIAIDKIESGNLDLVNIAFDILFSQGLSPSCFNNFDTYFLIKKFSGDVYIKLSVPESIFYLGSNIYLNLWDTDLIPKEMENPFLLWWNEEFPGQNFPKKMDIYTFPPLHSY